LDQGQKPRRAGSNQGDRGMKLARRRRKRAIKSLVVKQSVSINGHHSSISIEGAFWNALKEIAVSQNISANALVSKIDSERDATNLSSAIRVSVVEHYRLTASASADSQKHG
jgi:predicted DNA-binding ribbon-helix-helix protein